MLKRWILNQIRKHSFPLVKEEELQHMTTIDEMAHVNLCRENGYEVIVTKNGSFTSIEEPGLICAECQELPASSLWYHYVSKHGVERKDVCTECYKKLIS